MADSTDTERRPAFSLLWTGLIALAVSIWALLGAPTPDSGVLPVGWGVMIAASVIGLLLVLSPRRKRH
ncbi:hypothetical protein ACFXK0_20995 [Nocardia sp. NPDC059177]|uniref:hypothetical protein n=1 Tax=Nocardia sp. NPDC059177 TaxID=3346759 RepID=UPI0036C2EC1B